MNLSDAQRNAIRSDCDTYLYDDFVAIGNETFDTATVRALMRLGLCVVESQVLPAELRELIAFLDPHETNEHDVCALRMLHSLAAELECAK